MKRVTFEITNVYYWTAQCLTEIRSIIGCSDHLFLWMEKKYHSRYLFLHLVRIAKVHLLSRPKVFVEIKTAEVQTDRYK